MKHAKQQIGGLNELKDEPLVHIILAFISYSEGNINETLINLKKVVEINPNCPLDIWMGIGICYYKLNNLPKAKFALEHVV